MAIDSLAINLIALIPTIIFAIFVEKYYTSFWTGIWNFFALFVTGVSMFIIPIAHPPINSLWSFLPISLIILSFVMIALSIFLVRDIARIVGSSQITASLLLATYIFQYVNSSDIFIITFFSSFIAIFLIKWFLW
ncbi:MAG: hypothetical protein HY051_01830 [Candidatus Aenigmarchaeota archaeon]|nr:hypothetical protein [Candidatus Aenigmarchaeota archaeon]